MIQTVTPCYLKEKLLLYVISKLVITVVYRITNNYKLVRHFFNLKQNDGKMLMQKYGKSYCFRSLMIGLFAAVSFTLIFSGCRNNNKEMNAEEANEIITDRLDLNQEQSIKIAPITKDFFTEKEAIHEIQKAISEEILNQFKSDSVDKAELESTLTGSLDQIQAKISKFVKNFAEFHAVLNSEQRSEIVEKMEKRLEHAEKRGWGRKWRKHWH